MFEGLLRRKAIEAVEEAPLIAAYIPKELRKPLAASLNEILEGKVRMSGWKTILGSIAKGAGGVAFSYTLAHIPLIVANLPQGSATAGFVALALTFLGSALKDIGMGHKMDKNTAAINEQTAAVEAASRTPQPVAIVSAPPGVR